MSDVCSSDLDAAGAGADDCVRVRRAGCGVLSENRTAGAGHVGSHTDRKSGGGGKEGELGPGCQTCALPISMLLGLALTTASGYAAQVAVSSVRTGRLEPATSAATQIGRAAGGGRRESSGLDVRRVLFRSRCCWGWR